MRPLIRILVSGAIAATLLAALFVWGDVPLADAVASLSRLPFTVYVLGLGMHFVTYCLRAVRFRVLLPRDERPPFHRVLVVAAAHNLASYVLPAKTGEASFVLYLRLKDGVSTAAGLASLVVARFLDGAALCLGVATVTVLLLATGDYPGLEVLRIPAFVLFAAALSLVALAARADLFVRALGGLLRWCQVHRLRVGQGLLSRSNELARALRGTSESGGLTRAVLWTVPLWFNIVGFFALLVWAMGQGSERVYLETALSASLGSVANLIPTAAGVGTQELGWVTALHRFLGMDYEAALSVSVGAHFVQLFNVALMGIAGHLALGALPRLNYRALSELEDED